MIYLDYNATTPVSPQVVAAMRPFLEEFHGNPSSIHAAGRRTRAAVDDSRDQPMEGADEVRERLEPDREGDLAYA